MTRPYTWSPAGLAKRRAANVKAWTPDRRAAHAAIQKARWAYPAFREKTVRALREDKAKGQRLGVRSLKGSQRYQYRIYRICGVPYDEALRLAREVTP